MRPSKTFFYKMLYKDISSKLENNKKLNFIDFACGHGQLLHDFKFENYIGVDIDQKEIRELKLKFPNYKFFNEDILIYKSNIKCDLACCVETMGFNKMFDEKNIAKTINNITNNLNDGGCFYFNIHYDLYEKNKENLNFLSKNFKKIKIRRYGFLTNKRSRLIHKIFFQLEKIITKILVKGKYLYIKCEGYSPHFSTK